MGELLEISWFFHREHVHEWIWRLFKFEVGLDFDILFHDEDSSFLKAHSLVLKIFCQTITNSNSRQFRFVDAEIKADDVRCLLEFIYRGKTKVEKERLDVLKKAAEMLGLGVFVEIVNKIKNESSSAVEERDFLSQNVEINSESDKNKIIILSYDGISNLVEEAENSNERKVVDSADEIIAENQPVPEIPISKNAVQEHSYSLKRKLSEDQTEMHNIESCQSTSDHRVDCSFEAESSQQLKKLKLKYSLRLRRKSEKNVSSKPEQKCKSKNENLGSVFQYICPRCGKNYDKLSLMKEHLASHSIRKALSQCPFCPNQFRNLETHLAFKHHRDAKGNLLEKSLKCEQCDYSCSDKYLLQKHKKAKHGERCYKCDQCSYSSTTNGSLSKHKRQVHIIEKRFMCDTCGTFFKSRSCLKQHLRSHTGFRKECDICGLSVRGSYLSTHMKIHGNKRFKCVSCACIYRRKSDLRSHLKKIHKLEEEEEINNILANKEIIVEVEKSSENEKKLEKKKVSCDICGKVLANCSLSRHNMMFHSAADNQKRHKCCFEDCPMTFTYRSKLRAHLSKKHKMPEEEIEALFKKDFEEKIQELNEKRKLEGENLDETENDLWSYRVHDALEEPNEELEAEQSNAVNIENISGFENLFTCPVCDKVFKNEIVFLRHVKYHGSQTDSNLKNVDQRKPLMCPICDRKFKRKLVLDRHIEAHSDPKALIKCPYCTHQSMYLEEHLAEKHQRDMYGNFLEKAFKCEQCEFSCTVKWKLLYHVKVKHGEKTHKCELCVFSSTTNGQLLKHKREVHTAEKKFVCETCGAPFKSKNYLVKHRNTHLGMKFICEICGISLSSKHNVARHMKIHSDGEGCKKITCPVCFTFGARDRHNLKEHLKKKHKLADEEIASFIENT